LGFHRLSIEILRILLNAPIFAGLFWGPGLAAQTVQILLRLGREIFEMKSQTIVILGTRNYAEIDVASYAIEIIAQGSLPPIENYTWITAQPKFRDY
jgi:hypothetical protein